MRTPNERLIDILNKSSSVRLNVSDVDIRDVRLNDNEAIGRNTRSLLLARKNGKLMGTMEFYYNRLDLSKLFHGVNPTLLFNHGDRVTTQMLAAKLGEQFGIELSGEDVEQSGEIYLSRLPHTVTLSAKPGSYCVVGSLEVNLSERGNNVAEVMGVTSLSGLNPPNGNFDLIQGCLYSWNWSGQADLKTILRDTGVGNVVPATVCPFLTELDGQREWVDSETIATANIHGAVLSYMGPRDNHPYYGNGSRRDEIAVISLNDTLNSDIGGDLVISLY